MENGNTDQELLQQRIQEAEEIVQFDRNETQETWLTRRPAKLLSNLYLGDCGDANSPGMLTEMGVTHALNCAGNARGFFNQFPKHCGNNNNRINYKQFDADDVENYDMTQHFSDAISYVDDVINSHGKVLVYCKMGMNRSATVCIAYLIAKKRLTFLEAVQAVREKRLKILTNKGFLRQLAVFAQGQGLL